MIIIPLYPIVFLQAAHNGQLQLLKKSAASLDCVLGGGGIHAILENAKDEHGRCAIHYAATSGRINVLNYLIEEMGLDIDIQDGFGKTPLSRASIEGYLAAVEYLLAMGANPEILDGSDTSPLHYVAMKGRKDFIPLLLSKGSNVDVINGFGSPLQYAATAGEHDTVKVLLDHGAN
ncbi:hypothetical protein MKW94_028838, partial [Papaver nudicaule]|nr:hypothetical protein [Papaver nudicaule]